MSGETTKVDRWYVPLALVPESEWNVPEPLRSEVPEYVSYELVEVPEYESYELLGIAA